MNKKNILVFTPYRMSSRILLETPIINECTKQDKAFFHFCTFFQEDAEIIKNKNCPFLKWTPYPCYKRPTKQVFFKNKPTFVFKCLLWKLIRSVFKNYTGFDNIAYRFNYITGFRSHHFKEKMSSRRKEKEKKLGGNYVDSSLGFPFKSSKLMYKLIYNFYNSIYNWDDHSEQLLDEVSPDIIVIVHVQNPYIAPLVASARRRNIRTVGVIASWDQLTTKGPLPKGISSYMVQNLIMNEEIQHFHDVDGTSVKITGWPTLDKFTLTENIKDRADFLKNLGLAPNARYILYVTNSGSLGPHEPSIAKYIDKLIADNELGYNTYLVIRPHPNDESYKNRYEFLNSSKTAISLDPEYGEINFYFNLLHHSSIVVASTTTASIDAIVLNKPVTSITFDGNLKPDYYEQTARWFEMEHYRPVVELNATDRAYSYGDLCNSLKSNLKKPSLFEQNRKKLISRMIEPYDGKSSKRFVEYLLDEKPKDAHNHENIQLEHQKLERFLERARQSTKVKKNEFIRTNIKNKNVLDIGAVAHSVERCLQKPDKWLHNIIRKESSNVVGVDILKDEVKKLNMLGYSFIADDALTMRLDTKYEVVVLGDIIEHISDFSSLLETIKYHMEDDGVCIITTPNPFAINRFFNILVDGWTNINSEHTCWICPQTMYQLLKRHDLEIINFNWLKTDFDMKTHNRTIGWLLNSMSPYLMRLNHFFYTDFGIVAQKI